MVTMTQSPPGLPPSRPLTYDDLELMPDDGHRYELIDGVLIVTPAPSPRHQQGVLELAVLLRQHCPDDLQVFIAPLDVVLADDSAVQPDVLVARRADLTERNLPRAPLLAVEVLSPSTRGIDHLLKRERYERAGVPSYWIVDPAEPSILAWDLQDGRYVEVARAVGDELAELSAPYPVKIVPADLVL